MTTRKVASSISRHPLKAEIIEIKENGRVKIFVELSHSGTRVGDTTGPYTDLEEADLMASKLLEAEHRRLRAIPPHHVKRHL